MAKITGRSAPRGLRRYTLATVDAPARPIAEIAGPFWSGRALGMQNTSQLFTAGVVPPVFGALIGTFGFPLAFGVCALLPVVAAPLAGRLIGRYPDGLLGGMTYFGSMQPSADKLQLGRRVNGQSTVFKSPTFPTEYGLWYTMTIAAQGNDLSFGLDDQVLTAASDGELNKGGASIGGFGTGVAEFDWFLVCAAD